MFNHDPEQLASTLTKLQLEMAMKLLDQLEASEAMRDDMKRKKKYADIRRKLVKAGPFYSEKRHHAEI